MREAPTVPPSSSASSASFAKFLAFFIPLPPATIISASCSGRPTLFSASKPMNFISERIASSAGLKRTTSHPRDASGESGRFDLGRTVHICGSRPFVLMSAMTLPPIAGRVCTRRLLSGSIASSVQSAVSPQPRRALSIGMTVRPCVVAEAISIDGPRSSMSSASALQAISALKCSNSGSSAT